MFILNTTDTHYGFNEKTHRIHKDRFFKKMRKELDSEEKLKNTVLVHNGDWSSHKQEFFYQTLKMFREAFPELPILAVRGNHDFWGSDSEEKIKTGWKTVRVIKKFPTWKELNECHKEWFKKFNIHHLEDGPYFHKDWASEKDDVAFIGFDGWYYVDHPPTNDNEWMHPRINGLSTHSFLMRRAHDELQKVLDVDTQGKFVVGVTHFPPFSEDPKSFQFCANPSYMSFLTKKCNLLLVGHSHQKNNFLKDRPGNSLPCRVLNPGSDYNQPKYLYVKVENGESEVISHNFG